MSTTPSRRTVLHSGLVLASGGVAVAAGCASDNRSRPETGTGADPSVNGSAGSARASVAKSEVPQGGGVVLSEGGDFVVTQPEAGEYRAFSSICTHQGCPVSEVTDNQITCPCHGSAFSAADGSVVQGPAKDPLPPATVTESGEQLTVTN